MAMEVDFELVGATPLLMHADDVLQADDLKEWRTDPANKNSSVAGDDRSPAWTWQTYLYSDGKNVVWPAVNIMVGLRTAGAQVILKKQKTFKELTQSGMVIRDEFCEFVASNRPVPIVQIDAMKDASFRDQTEAVKKLGFLLYVKRAKVGQSKHVRVRARFDNWKVRGRIIVTAPEIDFDKLQLFFTIAGSGGLGDWRPACKTPGAFGQFKAKLTQRK